ncbi:histidine kinase [Rhodoferax sp.]|uniref:histidine kinase n=1 Tax=Rhodoferax sp. TaxID=50421 RepID=UPI002636B6C5|nr:histidine kinase [Rhodoferax sp.]MDD2808848.1 histidine kinase [Rhodoferax sp.]MDD4942439.1 histidine kinase [Rhodoferax sp.]
MQDSQILSVFQNPTLPPSLPRPQPALLFDACHVGVVLRALLFVESVMAVAALFGAASVWNALMRAALLTGGALPATLLWLLVACSFKKLLARLPELWQQAAGVGLGALAGLYGCGVLVWAGVLTTGAWWASACAGALLSGVLVMTLVWRVKSRTPAHTAARLAELQARIRPHFLFNTLNSAIALVRQEPRKAERLLEDLSDLFRHALIEQGEAVSLAEEIELAQRYLAIEAVRFGARLRIDWALDAQANAARLPPLLLQPLVENAVKHGVEPSASGADIRVSTQRKGSRVVIKVTNTVPVPEASQGSGLALANVRERLSLLHDVQARFQSGLKDGVFQVRIELPL